MKKKNKADINAKIKEVKQLIVSSSDAKHRGELVEKLLSLQKSLLHEPIELEVLCKDVKKTLDFGATKIMKTKRGYLFVAKGGLYYFVESKVTGVCSMFEVLFDIADKYEKGEIDVSLYTTWTTALQFVLQAPFFASINEEAMFSISNHLLSIYLKLYKDKFENAEVKEENEEDIIENNEMEQMSEAFQNIIDSPVPPVSE